MPSRQILAQVTGAQVSSSSSIGSCREDGSSTHLFPLCYEWQAQDREVRLNSIPQSSGFQTTLQNSQSFLGLFKASSMSEALTTKQRKCKLPRSASLLVIFYSRVLYKISYEKCLNITALDLFHFPLAFLPSPLHFSLIAKREKGLLSLKEPWANTACTY